MAFGAGNIGVVAALSTPAAEHGQETQEINEGNLLSPPLAQDRHQTNQATTWSEQVPNALDHLRKRSADRLRPGIPDTQLNGQH